MHKGLGVGRRRGHGNRTHDKMLRESIALHNTVLDEEGEMVVLVANNDASLGPSSASAMEGQHQSPRCYPGASRGQ